MKQPLFVNEAIRFQRHVSKLTSTHFQLMPDHSYLAKFHEENLGRYLRYLWDRSMPLLQAMALALVTIESINEKLISERKFSFVGGSTKKVDDLTTMTTAVEQPFRS